MNQPRNMPSSPTDTRRTMENSYGEDQNDFPVFPTFNVHQTLSSLQSYHSEDIAQNSSPPAARPSTIFEGASNVLLAGPSSFIQATNVTFNMQRHTDSGPFETHFQAMTPTHKRRRTISDCDYPDRPPKRSSVGKRLTRCSYIYRKLLKKEINSQILWIPGPNATMSPEYRLFGALIGDVGLFTREGAWDPLFNICREAGDAINPMFLPAGFQPVVLPGNGIDIRRYNEFAKGSYVSSTSVSQVQRNMSDNINDVIFESHSDQGAILMLPDGAVQEQLCNLQLFREYIKDNAENIYSYVTTTRGRTVKNGDLHIIYGTRKTSSWGMAAFAGTPPSNSRTFKFSSSKSTSGPPDPVYSWSHTGSAEVKVGPDPEENADLKPRSENGTKIQNQCLFASTISIRLTDSYWNQVRALRSERSRPSILHTDDAPTTNVTPVSAIDMLTDYMFKMVPHAVGAIISDKDFAGCRFDAGDTTNFLKSVCSINTLNEKDGIAYFERQELEIPLRNKVDEINCLILGDVTLNEYLFWSLDRDAHFSHLQQELNTIYESQELSILDSNIDLPQRLISLDTLIHSLLAENASVGRVLRHRSISELRINLQECSPDHEDHALHLKNLAEGLLYQFRNIKWAHLDDLHDIIWYLEHALLKTPATHYRHLELIIDLVECYHYRFGQLGKQGDLGNSLSCLQRLQELDIDTLLEPISTELFAKATRISLGLTAENQPNNDADA